MRYKKRERWRGRVVEKGSHGESVAFMPKYTTKMDAALPIITSFTILSD